MANINSVSNSYSSNSTNSLYGNRNILSGLASGMDTETMIQNSIVGYQTRITSLQQDQTTLEWKQDAMREITDQMNSVIQKYTSYTSKTNLSSNAFFTGATTTAAQGENAAAISALGKAKSDIQINAVTRLATAARYSVAASALNFNNAVNLTGGAMGVSGNKTVSTIAGSLTLTAGSEKFTIDFSDDEVFADADALVTGINKKLGEQKAKIEATLEGGEIKFKSTAGNGDSVYLSGATGNFKNNLDVDYAPSSSAEDRFSYNSISVGGKTLSGEVPMAEYLSNKTVEVTLDGVTKKISVGTLTQPDLSSYDDAIAEKKAAMDALESGSDEWWAASTEYKVALQAKSDAEKQAITGQIRDNLQSGLNRAFGSGAVSVELQDGALKFGVRENSGSTLKATSSAQGLGLESGVTNYFDTGRKLSSLLGEDYFKVRGSGASAADEEGVLRDENGKRVDENGYRINDDGSYVLEDKELVVNGVSIGKFGKDAALDEVMNHINSSAEAGVNVSFSRLTGEFVFTAKNTGAGQGIEFGDGLGKTLFGDTSSAGTFTAGTDAEVRATVNGRELTLQRASNVIDMDGMSVTLKSTFTEGEAVTFKTTADSDKVVDAVKGFVEDVNKLMNDLYSSFNTMPAEKNSKHERYRPLTDDDKKDMSESAVKAYEEKAKQGILFGDSDLRQLFDRLRTVITPSGKGMADLKEIGITTEYSKGVTTLKLDEEKLRSVLEGDPDKVREVFATNQSSGSSQATGWMEKIKTTMNAYASTSLSNPGILVRKAGTKLSSLSLLNNDIQKQINNVNKQIESWQTKLSNRVDYYTKRFTALEKLVATMNEQSSMLMGLSGN